MDLQFNEELEKQRRKCLRKIYGNYVPRHPLGRIFKCLRYMGYESDKRGKEFRVDNYFVNFRSLKKEKIGPLESLASIYEYSVLRN